ncbi:MAG: hypothetical protein CVT99_09700 [Bacteroidetes bacterium HGW-Bacteroidetes-16]|jgi:DNA uptake protein ComE-like DNA-binding protein|nr:MAG: hypothetical protein CVT99_09700 [Bacteroidetes bacterium HGW-Bacteroidetes-16]
MLSRIKHWFLPFFSLNKSEQYGILVLTIIVLVLLLANLLMPFFVSPGQNTHLEAFKNEIEAFKQIQQSKRDSIYIEDLQNSGMLEMEIALQKIKPIPFDPNKLPDEIWLKMGFTPTQVKNIKNYEAKGGKFYRKEDVKKLYSISDAEYQLIEPYIQIKSPYQTKPAKENPKFIKTESKRLLPTEINSADAGVLENNLGINPWLAKRVIDYRTLLGGFHKVEQLLEVYGMKPETYEKILLFISIDTLMINKIDLNTVTFKEMLRHPYLDYETTKSIIDTRKKIKSYSSLDQLHQVPSITDTIFQRIAPYFFIPE